MKTTLRLPYPKVQFFKPDDDFWKYADRNLQPPAPETAIGQVGLREDFSAANCDRPRGTRHHYFFVRFDHALKIWEQDREDFTAAPAGATILWAPGMRHRYGAYDGQTVTHTYIFVRGGLAHSVVRSLSLPLNRILAGVSAASFETHIFPLIHEFTRGQPQPAIVENCVSNLLHSIASDLESGGVSKSDQRLLRVKRTLDLDPAKQYRLTDLAAAAHLTPSHLSDAFKRAFGRSPIEHLISLRMGHARHLLTATDLAIKQIAAQVGYGDPYFFSRLFKRHCGVSPRAFRERKRS